MVFVRRAFYPARVPVLYSSLSHQGQRQVGAVPAVPNSARSESTRGDCAGATSKHRRSTVYWYSWRQSGVSVHEMQSIFYGCLPAVTP